MKSLMRALHLYPSYFTLQGRWHYSFSPVKFLTHCVAAFLQLELFWVYLPRAYERSSHEAMARFDRRCDRLDAGCLPIPDATERR
ncbi:hypothetical protein CRH15_20300 [Lelliottia amnigena]|nr:hypothetical protein CO697_17420 [Lelliottia amnigena]PEG63093.1 hypothetical protein CRH15_20300 [Lelliottia amnigena]